MNPKDGQLYVSGMTGWGSYTPLDGCFQRVRYTGEPAQLPVGFHAVENGVLVTFAQPRSTAKIAEDVSRSHFAQAWNYKYGPGYGSQELSPGHPGVPGHDPWAIRSAHVLDDGRTLFLELPDLQPVNQLHLRLNARGRSPSTSSPRSTASPAVHRLPGLRAPAPKTIAAHPILADMAALTHQAHAQPLGQAHPGCPIDPDRGRQEPELRPPDPHRQGPTSRSS